MQSGFEVYDQNSKLQITSGLLTYALRLSGTTFVEARKVGNTSPNSLSVPTTNTYVQCLVALGGGNGFAAAYAGRRGDNNQRIYATNAPVGTAFDYFIFERSNVIPAINNGLEVRNQAQEVIFSSAQRVMQIVNLIGGVVNNGEQAVTYPGRRLAFCQGNFALHRISGPLQADNGGGPIIIDDNPPAGTKYRWQNDGKVYGGFVTNSGQTVQTRMISWDDVTAGPTTNPTQPPDYHIPLSLFVVDVTGVPVGVQFF